MLRCLLSGTGAEERKRQRCFRTRPPDSKKSQISSTTAPPSVDWTSYKINSMVNACPRFRNVLVNADYRAPLLAAINRYFVELLFRVHGGNCVTLVTAVNRYFVEFFLADGGNCVTLLTAVWGTLFGSDNCSTC